MSNRMANVRISMQPPRLWLALGFAVLSTSVLADAVKDREGAVRNDRATMENDKRWIYNDWQRGFEQAKWAHKPLLVVLRCVPCLSCQGIDAGVLTQPDLAPLLDQFVCVRLINANTLDLALFQVDYDLSFSAVMFNGDGTVYGRFGSWKHQKNSQDKDTAGFKRALEGAVAIHKNYPANKMALAGKQGAPMPFKTSTEIPELAKKYKRELDWEGKVVQSCVHCHQVGDAVRTFYREQKKAIPAEWIYPWPAPDSIGASLAPDYPAKVESVASGSIAAKSGLQAGDEVLSIAGQPLVSIADVSWVLHRAPESASLPALVKRGNTQTPVTIELPAGWRNKASEPRRVGTWHMRGMATGGLVLEDLPDDVRATRGIDKGDLALLVKFVGQYNNHAAAKRAGFQKDDVLVQVGGLKKRMSEGEFMGTLLQNNFPGEKLKTTVLRGDQRVELMLPMQ
jgi:serine protease Do